MSSTLDLADTLRIPGQDGEARARSILLQIQNKEETGDVSFSSYDVAQGVAYFFAAASWEPADVLGALLAMVDGDNVDGIWKRSQGSPPSWWMCCCGGDGYDTSSSGEPCPWLSQAAEKNALDVVGLLLKAGVSPEVTGIAIAAAVGTEMLRLLCASGPVPAPYLERALVTVLFTSTAYDGERAAILAETAQRLGYREALNSVLLNPSRDRHPDCMDIIRLLLSHGADVSAGEGSALVACATSGNVAMVEELLGMDPDETSLSNTLKAALDVRPRSTRLALSRLILGAPKAASGIGQSEALVVIMQEEHGPDVDMARLLLASGASVNHQGGKAMEEVVRGGNVPLLSDFLGATEPPSEATVTLAFETALSSLTDPVRIQVAKALLHHGVNHLTRSTHLLSAVEGRDMELVDSMLAGGGIDWNVAKNAVIHAAQCGYTPELSAMINKAVPPAVAAAALEVLVETGHLDTPEYIQNAGHLLGVGLPAGVRNTTLLRVFQTEAQGLPHEFIALLLQYGANPMVDGGRCFGIAAQRDDIVAAVQLVTAPRFDLDVAVRALITSINAEDLLVKWLNVCLGYLEDVHLRDHSLLPLTIEKFPVSTTFLASLMDNGCEPGLSCGCLDGTGAATSLLMWALEVNGRASDAILMQILERQQQCMMSFHSSSHLHLSPN